MNIEGRTIFTKEVNQKRLNFVIGPRKKSLRRTYIIIFAVLSLYPIFRIINGAIKDKADWMNLILIVIFGIMCIMAYIIIIVVWKLRILFTAKKRARYPVTLYYHFTDSGLDYRISEPTTEQEISGNLPWSMLKSIHTTKDYIFFGEIVFIVLIKQNLTDFQIEEIESKFKI